MLESTPAQGILAVLLVVTLLVTILVVLRMLVNPPRPRPRNLAATYIAAYGLDGRMSYQELRESQPRPLMWRTDQEWRKFKGVPFWDTLTEALSLLEQRGLEEREKVPRLHLDLAIYNQAQRSGKNPGLMKPTLDRVGEILAYLPDDPAITLINERCEQLDRLWSGDTYKERVEREDELKRLEQNLADWTKAPVDDAQTRAIRSLNEAILRTKGELRDLEEIKRRAVARLAVSQHQMQFRESHEIDQLDVIERARDRIRSCLTKVEVLRQTKIEIEKIRNDQRLSDEDKKLSIGLLEKEAASLFSDTSGPKTVDIYKIEQ